MEGCPGEEKKANIICFVLHFSLCICPGPLLETEGQAVCTWGWRALLILMFLWLLTNNKLLQTWCWPVSETEIKKARSQLHPVILDFSLNQLNQKSRLSVLNRSTDTRDLAPDFPKTPHEFTRTSVPVRTEKGVERLPECSFCPPCQSVSHQQMLGAKGQAPCGLSYGSSMAASRAVPS